VCADAQLRRLIERRIEELAEYGDFYDSSSLRIIVIEVGDFLQDSYELLGFDLIGRNCDSIEKHASWFELTFVISDDGAGVVVFVTRSPFIHMEILSYCNRQMNLMSP
jgi:hypothetical protein